MTVNPSSNETTFYLYDRWNVLTEEGNTPGAPDNTSNPLKARHTWGLDLRGTMQGAGGVGGLLATRFAEGAYYPTYDGNGNESEYLDAQASWVAHYEYGPFGETSKTSGAQGYRFSYRSSTKPMDGRTGLYYYGYRYYDPTTERWINRDPIGERGGENYYNFTFNQPTWTIDVLGLFVPSMPYMPPSWTPPSIAPSPSPAPFPIPSDLPSKLGRGCLGVVGLLLGPLCGTANAPGLCDYPIFEPYPDPSPTPTDDPDDDEGYCQKEHFGKLPTAHGNDEQQCYCFYDCGDSGDQITIPAESESDCPGGDSPVPRRFLESTPGSFQKNVFS